MIWIMVAIVVKRLDLLDADFWEFPNPALGDNLCSVSCLRVKLQVTF